MLCNQTELFLNQRYLTAMMVLMYRDYPDVFLDGMDSNTTIIMTSITDEMQWAVKIALPSGNNHNHYRRHDV